MPLDPDLTEFTTQGPQVVTFDWEDIFKGIGYISYFCGISQDTGGVAYFFSSQIQESQPPSEAANATPKDLDFDLDFDAEEDIEGLFLINFTQRPGSSGAAGTCNTAITIYHVDSGASETSLGTAQTATRSGSGTFYRENLQINISRQHFSPGEKLRINVIFTGSANSADLPIDPASSLTFTDTFGRTVGSDFIVQVPFKIES